MVQLLLRLEATVRDERLLELRGQLQVLLLWARVGDGGGHAQTLGLALRGGGSLGTGPHLEALGLILLTIYQLNWWNLAKCSSVFQQNNQ